MILLTLPACATDSRVAQLTREKQTLREEIQRLEHENQQVKSELASSRQQVGNLSGLGEHRATDLFAPVSIEIASLSGGTNMDDRPGDDGITVHLKPKDADGQVVKVPGAIAVQLLDNSDLANPRVLAVCEVREPGEIRTSWMGILGTHHYTIKCPFPRDTPLPQSQKITVNVSFTDFLTGRVLTASREMSFTP
jgi:hypothetical protein